MTLEEMMKSSALLGDSVTGDFWDEIRKKPLKPTHPMFGWDFEKHRPPYHSGGYVPFDVGDGAITTTTLPRDPGKAISIADIRAEFEKMEKEKKKVIEEALKRDAEVRESRITGGKGDPIVFGDVDQRGYIDIKPAKPERKSDKPMTQNDLTGSW